ncbi:MAG: RpiB/LacA/LacB family sugar-phosphate isomerase [Thermoguttaceae bacterium]
MCATIFQMVRDFRSVSGPQSPAGVNSSSCARRRCHANCDRKRPPWGGNAAANKIPGVRAAPCYDDVTAELSRRHNDLNVLCLSGDMLGERLVDRLVEIWLFTPFDGGRHARRLRKINALERNGKKHNNE